MEDALSNWERQIGLVSSLLKSRRPMSRLTITRAVEGYGPPLAPSTVRKRLQRDIAELAAFGVKIEFIKAASDAEEGYVIDHAKTFLPNIEITGKENMLLDLLSHSLSRSDCSAITGNLRTALLKLQCSSGMSGSADADLEEKVLIRKRLGGRSNPSNLKAAFSAVSERRTASFDYRPGGADLVQRRIADVWGLGFYHAAWYIVGRCHERDETRVFKLNRIVGRIALAARSSYEVPADFKVDDYAGIAPWRIGSESIRARVRFDAEIAWMIANNVRSTDTFDLQPDGGGTLGVEVRNPLYLVRWVLKFKRHARILGPDELVKLAVAELENISRRYERVQLQ